ncbi:MAG TPA: STAS domain-containing protein [Actinomycetota bacterium]|nr:STAS domain-containing protein [Actinomycetota bacterium]
MVGKLVQLNIVRESLPEADVVRVSGELDISSSPALREELTEVARGGRNVILDLADLRFMDSTGLSVIIAALKRLRERSLDLLLCAPQPPVRRTLEICGLDEIITIRPTEADTLDHLRSLSAG